MAKDNFGRKPQNYKGTKDYDGLEAAKRNYVMQQIRDVFELFGFEPLETPAIELTRILDGKYGEDGQSKIFRLSSSQGESLGGLRYDHTVPLARFMSMNPSSKVLPYRRYAIGPVWRNESVQAGRTRQFIQCDFDTVGSNSLVVDAEILAINFQVLTRLGFPVGSFVIQYNNRELLNTMTKYIGCTDEESLEVLRAWDKLEKVGIDGTVEELKSKKVSKQVLNNYQFFTAGLMETNKKFLFLKENLGEMGKSDLANVANLYHYALSLGVPEDSIMFNPLLARGLDYYTGPIFETVIKTSGIGSISGGGRFDNLVETLGGPSLPASGSSFGLERVMYVMEQLGINIPVQVAAPVFVTIFDQNNLKLVQYSFKVASMLRLDGIPVEVYTGTSPKLGKQIEIGSRKGSQIVVILGDTELSNQEVTYKILSSGKQETIPLDKFRAKIFSMFS